MNNSISYSACQPSPDLSERIFVLHQQVYGDSTAFRQRWEWEFIKHPRNSEIILFCAERDGQLVGVTVRHPVTLKVDDKLIPAWFASNSMVRTDMQGQGIMRNLYLQAIEETGAIQFSKGTAEGMYEVLKKIGYQEIVPNTYQTALINPFKWAVQRFLHLPDRRIQKDSCEGNHHSTRLAGVIPDDVDQIRCNGILKDARYLAWRYCTIPHKRYNLYLRRVDGKPVSFFALRYSGNTAYLVEFIWDSKATDEPSASVNIAKKEARRMGACKMIAWTASDRLRNTLGQNGFFSRKESPHFSYFSPSGYAESIAWSKLAFVHGDGDIDYL